MISVIPLVAAGVSVTAITGIVAETVNNYKKKQLKERQRLNKLEILMSFT